MLEFIRKIAALIFLVIVVLWCALGIYDFNNVVEGVGTEPVIKISGYFNNTSSFVLFGFFLPSIPMALINVITGAQLPRLTLRLMLLGSLFFALIGHYMDAALRQGIKTSSYVECTADRELSLKHSSRTYALNSKLCD
ncbi:hypothetical protein [Vibrio panuliri]|uniref:Uncharacterized protein n=1 Tax=Vibrio panuliri TaxID=1381081 RepID=A0ABX3FP04_9VIBR|nr:hypothetical protein [Vibrio panuliri]KAB1458340.1 hypothetical protein F7O85_04705 [Vibrio panuliri]OLQ95667.1 hypothetical protein BIY20_20885 [Vibrio panuliri]